MSKINVISVTSLLVLVMVMMSLSSPVMVNAKDSYTLGAPQLTLTIKPPNDYQNFDVIIDGWICGSTFIESPLDKTIDTISKINRLIQPLVLAQQKLVVTEKTLIQMGRDKIATLSKDNVRDTVNRAIDEAMAKAGYTTTAFLKEMDWINLALEHEGKNVDNMFGHNEQNYNFFRRVDGDLSDSHVWKLSSIIDIGSPPAAVVFKAHDCYNRQDFQTMFNAVKKAENRLHTTYESWYCQLNCVNFL